ncbi:MAG TPA: sigma 54-interacting transcriptional regulator [Kofleriaceae bacterium]|nr:sigma 54-interacting transcriptional regulator [Kofleriaceae bacterium]
MESGDDDNDELGLTAVTAVVPSDTVDENLPGHLQLFVIGSATFATYPLADAGALTIGRGSNCDIEVDDRSISRRHAILSIGETVTIEDLGSANGTFVRGQRVTFGHPTAIAVGELVVLGTANIILQRRAQPVVPRRVWTHEAFEAQLEEECVREARSGTPFGLLRIHADRRAPARFIEETLAELLRETDILAHEGAHEYTVLLPDTPAASAEGAARRIDGKMLERGLKCQSFVACCPRDGRTVSQLNARAQAPAVKEKAISVGADVVVSDARMQGLHRLVEQVAGSSICVLLLGETGVGKEVFARAVHRASPRASGPFVEVNCAALTETLLESELFGHERGAFTNAVSAKPGLLELAHGGTLLLDEIGDMPLSTQVKLLRVIEDSQLRRVGGLKARQIDVRFVAATNSDIEAKVDQGAFRRDLFFRLNGVTIQIPPLRERVAELEPLARAFIRARAPSDARPDLSPDALDRLRAYRWPGNIRELKNVIERAVLLCGNGPILPEHLSLRAPTVPPAPEGATRPSPFAVPWPRASQPRTPNDGDTRETLLPAYPRKGSQEEQQWIMATLERAGGNQTVAARLLGISRRTLVNRLNDYEHVNRPRKKPKEHPSE